MNLIICSLDTLRADHLTCLGDQRGLTPNLDRIASEGALFSQVYASDIPTQPSHTALFTGQFGINTGIVSHFHPAAYLPEETLWLPSLLRREGYTTGAVDHLFAMKDWFIRGYDDYLPPPGRSRSPGSVINGIGLPWITDHRDVPFFLFLHFWDAHIPYVPPSPFRERYSYATAGRIDPEIMDKLEARPSFPLFKQNLYDFLDSMPNLDYIADLYDAEVAYLDYEIGRIFDHLEAEGLMDDTAVVLFGDHGENMTEHDAWFDHAGLYDSVTHVPLVIWRPGRVPPVRCDSMVQLVDVLPTVLELLDLPPAQGIDGRSLYPLMRGEVTTHRETVMLSEATWQAARGIRTDDWKLITYLHPTIYGRDGTELYDLAADPTEQVNVAADHPEVVERLSAQIKHWASAQLGGRPDPMFEVIDAGLPAVARLHDVIDGLTRPRHDVPAASAADPVSVPVAAVAPAGAGNGLAGAGVGVGVGAGVGAAAGALVAANAATDHLDPQAAVAGGEGGAGVMTVLDGGPPVDGPADAGQRFAPRNPHGSRLRRARGGVVAAIVAAAAVLLGVAVNDLLLSSSVQASGQVEPATLAALNMSSTGAITAINVRVGQHVTKGEVLATQDAGSAQAALAADQATLAADQATLAQQKSGGATPSQLQTLQGQVAQDQTQVSSAQAKVSQVQTSSAASVATAQSQVQTDQALLGADLKTYQDDLPVCTSTNPPATQCANDKRQVQVDQGDLTTAQAAEQQAVTQQQAQLSQAQGALDQANTLLTSARNSLAAADTPGSPQQIATTTARIQQDMATVTKDQQRLAQTSLVAPFDGVVTAINGTVGELATAQGVRQATAPASVDPSTTTGIQLFPQGPTSGHATAPTTAALVSLASAATKLVVQVPETDIHQVRVSQGARATLPSLPGATYTAKVVQIEPTPVVVNGETNYLVDLTVAAPGPSSGHGSPTAAPGGSSKGGTPAELATLESSTSVGLTVDVSF